MRKVVETANASKGDGPYSQAVTSGGFLFISGQGPLDPLTGEILGTDIEEQTHFTLKNILQILHAAHCTTDHVVKVTVILSDMRDFERFNTTYKSFFDKPYPARTCFSGGLGDILVEIDVIAKLP
ncbi:Rid family detoxifying hydrolase [Paenibacillus qinlingensis]|uniref:Rid family detoxifying hydrolase n=1 Tax=Paenibacillus qinlingensis TaxID=1837343 RepID=UPI0015652954|nr:Rid family detoxifying hydrolase [Paenibacillus qinlingensis]NQX64239.1 reactive intermediate/imine deaminase [Paenibacillus qinlingensis]